jgi:hypothetical protein
VIAGVSALLVLLLAAGVTVLMVQRSSGSPVRITRQLASGEDAESPVKAHAADDARTVHLTNVAADKLGRFAITVWTQPVSAAVPVGAQRQLLAVSDGIADLEERARQFSMASSVLSAITGPQAVIAALGEIAALPNSDIQPEDLAEFTTRARADVMQPDAAPAERAVAARVSGLLTPADRHADAKAALLAEMASLGLDADWPALPGWGAYARLAGEYDAGVDSRALALAREIDAVLRRQAEGLEAAIGSGLLRQRAAEAGAVVARDLRAAAEKYVGQIKTVLAGAAGRADAEADAVVSRLQAAPDLLARCDELIGQGESAAAIAALAEAGFPVAPSWSPSRVYGAAWTHAADRLRALAEEEPQQTVSSLLSAADDQRSRISELGTEIDSVVAAWRQQGADGFSALTAAASTVKRNAARALCAPGAARDATDPVRAATAVMCIDQVAALNLAGIVRNAIPQPAAADPPALEDQLSATERFFAALQRNAILLSGVDGLLAPLIAAAGSHGGEGLAKAMVQLTPVPAEVGRAFGDVVAFAHHPLQGIGLDAVAQAAIHHVASEVLPSLGSATREHGAVGLATALLELKGSLLATMIEDPEELPGKIVWDVVQGGGQEYLREASKTAALEHARQQAESALHTVAHSAGLALPDVLHTAAAHIPFVTLALSATREIRLYRDEKTTLDHAVLGVAVDTGSVIVGIGVAELAGHAIAGAHPGFFVQIPLTILGSVAGRSFARHFRQRDWKKARADYQALSETCAGRDQAMAAELAGTVRTTISRERTLYLARVGYPELLERAEVAELEALTTQLRKATIGYADTVENLIRAAAQIDGKAGARPRNAVSAVAAAVPKVSRSSTAQERDGRYASALLTLTEDPLPVLDGWHPARRYRAECEGIATRLSELSDQNRIRLSRWLADSAAEYRRHKEVMDSEIAPKVRALEAKASADRAALLAAAQAEQRARDSAGVKEKH